MPFRYRPDGDFIKNIDHNRRVMPYIMKSKMESVVYFEQKIPSAKTWKFLKEFQQQTGTKATIFHLVIWAGAKVIQDNPHLNRFISGKRIYQRRGMYMSFSAKKEMTENSPIVAIKRKIEPHWDFETLVKNISGTVREGKSDNKSHTDIELSLLFKFPRFIVSFFAYIIMKLDHLGLMPGFMIRNDPLFASVFIANLGSIGLGTAYHHLFEYGTIPLFITIGKQENQPFINAKNEIVVQPGVSLKYSFDERIADGFYCLRALKQLEKIIKDPNQFISLTPETR